MTGWLYRFYDRAGRLLYVGCTRDFARRRIEHARKPWWGEVAITVRVEMEYETAWELEQDAVRTAPGVHNVTQLETARRGWETRRRTQAALHASGAPHCNVANCRRCATLRQKAAS